MHRSPIRAIGDFAGDVEDRLGGAYLDRLRIHRRIVDAWRGIGLDLRHRLPPIDAGASYTAPVGREAQAAPRASHNRRDTAAAQDLPYGAVLAVAPSSFALGAMHDSIQGACGVLRPLEQTAN